MRKSVKQIVLSTLSIVIVFALLVGGVGVADMFGEHFVALPVAATDSDGGSTTPPQSTPSKSANPIRVRTKPVKIEGAKVQKKKQSVKKDKAFSITNAKGTVQFKKKSGHKKISITKKGVIKIKKGLKPGTYKLKVYVSASGNSSYESAIRTVTVKIKITTITNTLSVEGHTVDVKSEEIADSSKLIKGKEAILVEKAKGKLTYKKKSGDNAITVNASNGDLTVEQGLAPGTYRIEVAVTAAGNKKFKKTTKTAAVTVVVLEPEIKDTDTNATP